MPGSSQTAVERNAIRELIRAKSDREIARLLRQSYRILNLHRRRKSTISHRERWTDYELRLLGRIRDEELAKLLRRGVTAVAGKRESLGIPIFAPQRIRWSKREIDLLGKRPGGCKDAWSNEICGAVETTFAGHSSMLGTRTALDTC